VGLGQIPPLPITTFGLGSLAPSLVGFNHKGRYRAKAYKSHDDEHME